MPPLKRLGRLLRKAYVVKCVHCERQEIAEDSSSLEAAETEFKESGWTFWIKHGELRPVCSNCAYGMGQEEETDSE